MSDHAGGHPIMEIVTGYPTCRKNPKIVKTSEPLIKTEASRADRTTRPQNGRTSAVSTLHIKVPSGLGFRSGQTVRNRSGFSKFNAGSHPVSPPRPESDVFWHGQTPRRPLNRYTLFLEFQYRNPQNIRKISAIQPTTEKRKCVVIHYPAIRKLGRVT